MVLGVALITIINPDTALERMDPGHTSQTVSVIRMGFCWMCGEHDRAELSYRVICAGYGGDGDIVLTD